MECDRDPSTVDDSMEVDDGGTPEGITTWQFSQLKGVIGCVDELPAEGKLHSNFDFTKGFQPTSSQRFSFQTMANSSQRAIKVVGS